MRSHSVFKRPKPIGKTIVSLYIPISTPDTYIAREKDWNAYLLRISNSQSHTYLEVINFIGFV